MPLPVFLTKEPIDKGWSGDKKYCVTTPDGAKYLLRVTPAARGGRCEEMLRLQGRVAALGVPVCRPVAFGPCDQGVYTLQSWVDGQDAEAVIPRLADARQYALGVEAGKMLQKMHSIPAPAGQPDWAARFNAKIDRKIQRYRACPIRFEGARQLIGYLNANRPLLAGRPQTFQHGDYHIGNMMMENGRLVIIDFDRFDFGDPWEEFNRIVWCAQKAPAFARGIIDGYFPEGVPPAFWRLLALYISSNTLGSIPWAIPFGEREVQTMLGQAGEVLAWYDGMRRVIPTWYSQDSKAGLRERAGSPWKRE